jgi:hypothetical protein
MRFNFNKIQPKEGDIRIVEKFLLFPRIINKELRWLERAKIKQRYEDEPWPDSRAVAQMWVNKEWVN